MTADPWGAVLDEAEKLRKEAETAAGVAHNPVPLETPPEGMGDVAFAIFPYAKQLRKGPDQIAKDLVALMPEGTLLTTREAVGGYVNMRLDMSAFSRLVFDSALAAGGSYGSLPPKKVRVLLEHTSVNPTGPIHIGRARNPIIGDSLARIMKMAGYEVSTEYLVNDVGRQMVLLYWGVKNIDPKDIQPPEREKEDFRLVKYYQKANELLEGNEELDGKIKDMILRFESGDVALTREIRAVAEKVLRGILESLDRIDVHIDNFYWESDLIMSGSAKLVVNKLRNKFLDEGGALFLDLAPYGIKGEDTRWFLTRKDGTTLYPTRDIAYHLTKFDRCDVAINVLGEDQKLGQQQLKVGLQLIGAPGVPEALFYSFVALPEGRMSTRSGRVVSLDDLADESVERAAEEVRKRRPELPPERVKEIAEIVGLGALRYNIVRLQPEKKIVFKWEEALNFEGNSAPFLQYAHARTCGILSKAGERSASDPSALAHPSELRLVKTLGQFPHLISVAAESRRPHFLASYAYEAASHFNIFYRDCQVLQVEEPLRSTRLALVEMSRTVLSNALHCIGLRAPAEM